MDFSEFSLHEDLLKGIAAAGYVTCTPVQEQVLKTSLSGDDLYVQSQTGTGKTAAYLVPTIQELIANPENSGKKALILVPTRELAVQVEEEAKNLVSATKLSAFSFYGGVGYSKQVEALQKGVDFIIGTPGRIIDLKKGGQLDLSAVAFLVIDEADRMFDMGFYPDLREILKFIPNPESRQTMLFSATLNTYVKNLAWEYTRDAKEITIEAENITVDEIDQELIHVSSDKKLPLLLGILGKENPASVLIFCNTKRGAEVLGKRLKLNGYQSEFLIGDMQQSKRLEVMNRFKEGKVSMLVATDVAARGIDVDDLAMVVNYDLPIEPENYVHRIGRTARAGKSGKAYTFCSEKDVYDLPAIERYIDKKIPAIVCADDMLSEDKSKGVYIKLDSYGYDERDEYHSGKGERHSKGSRRRDEKSSRRKFDRPQKRSDSRRSDFRSENRGAKKSFEAEQNLEGLSFEERMAVYKKKYAGNSVSEQSANFAKRGRAEGKDFSKKKNRKNSVSNSAKPKSNASRKGGVSRKADVRKEKKTLENTGFFARLKKFFGGKGK
ncbi:MAG: DEAD/DEAH box helicase [Treponemataceae bacterium]|nr:DEAD/DEAH box helicase [Treponemataceae bacterium]